MPTTIHDILAELYDSSTDERDKGDKFERLMAAYLRTDATWTDRFSKVWMWQEWPDRMGKTDTGIDLVAEERDTGGLTAIQCKFYAPDHTLQKSDIDSFFTASGKAGFSGRVIVSTTDKWTKHAEDALEGQQVAVTRLRVQDLDESTIDWSQFSLRTPTVLVRKDKKVLRPHQQAAIDDVLSGFEVHDRGKLIMACGTGKTFTSLRLAERVVKPGGSILFLVPSISLLSQTLREWTAEAEIPIRPFAVCSDTKVGKKTENEDISPYDLAFPASTNAAKLHARMSTGESDGRINVVFSTYQSLPVVAEAQRLGLNPFDLIICDEAHRTTGVTLPGEQDSNFVVVHDQGFIKASKRLYMTATPRIYDDASKSQATEGGALIVSMDDEATYGPEFHRLGFGEAVSRDLLTDYRVLVLAVDEQAVSRTFQSQLADKSGELGIDDAAKIVGCWNGLAKKGRAESGFGDDSTPMQRAVAFSRSIEDSKRFARLFNEMVEQQVDMSGEPKSLPLQCEVDHVDGTFNVLLRNQRLDWLKAPLEPNTCRVLTNARCLSEGVDVPALDAVMFLNPRNSVVDVVQSVGRVMRKAPGKEYGYVILPIGIPADMTPEQALASNERYRVVWQVLQALRAHDERFNAMVNQIELNKAKPGQLQVIGIPGHGDGSSDSAGAVGAVQGIFDFPNLGEWRDAIYAKIVKKVGDRRYWEDWAKDVSIIAGRHTDRIKGLLDDPAVNVNETFEDFLAGLRGNLNDSITRDDAVDMLAQHLITKPVFDVLFEGYSFAENNPVSMAMQAMLEVLDAQNLQHEQEGLAPFYESVRIRAEGIDNAEGKQRIINELYERFFKLAFPRVAESLGIVYTPVEVVDFILNSVEHVLRTEFGASISDPGIHVLDPFTGTGTFATRLLQSGLIHPDDLLRKYTEELHANEILLLAYYIAAINVEATFHGIAGGEYVPFKGIVLTDTFQMTEADDTMDEIIFPENNERVAAQKSLDIRVVVGNPPYSVGQGSENDNNKKMTYPTLDNAIRTSYAASSQAGLKRNLYDSFIRAFRWATDRIGNRGVIGFVSNGSFIDGGYADGFRRTLFEEFSSIYVFNLRGNQRTSGETSREEGGKVFGQGSRTPIAITLLVKGSHDPSACKVHYHDIGSYLSREEKLRLIASFKSISAVPWIDLEPNLSADWINQRGALFQTFQSLGSKKETDREVMFAIYSLGVVTARDAWAYNFSKEQVLGNMQRMITFYNDELDRYQAVSRESKKQPQVIEKFIDTDATKISWTRSLKADLRKGKHVAFSGQRAVVSMYRPFCKQWLYFDRRMNEMVYQIPKLFPTPVHPNLVIATTGSGSPKTFSALICREIPNYHMHDTGQCFPLYFYEKVGEDLFNEGQVTGGYMRRDAVSDTTLARYKNYYGGDIDKPDIFYYVYGVLHSPEYRERFSADIKKMIPRIPMTGDFWAFSRAGRELAEWHLNYETVEPWPLEERVTQLVRQPDLRVSKMRFGKVGKDQDKSTIIYNSTLALTGLPLEAYDYQVNGKSAIEWVMDRYEVKTDRDSKIVNDPNDWATESGDPRYIVDLVKRIVRVSLETMKVVNGLPTLDLADPTSAQA